MDQAANLPGAPPTPPVPEILGRARAYRRRRRAAMLAATAAATAVAVTVPVALAGHRTPHESVARPPLPGSTAYPRTGAGAGAGTAAALARARWTTLPPAPIAGRNAAASAWTGRQFLVWGGLDDASVPYSDGA